MQRPVWQQYQVPYRYTTCRPVYQHHVRTIQEVCYRTVTEPRQAVYRTGISGAIERRPEESKAAMIEKGRQ